MPVTVADFKAKFSEFAGTPDELIQLAIDDATVTHRPGVWRPEDVRNLGILYKAATLLSLNPRAKCVRLDPKNPDTIYDKRWKELARSVYPGPQVL